MAILEGNIRLVKSQVMDDVPEGGGRATGTVIADGASNAIFNDISEVDRAIGNASLRKVSVHINTPDTDGYFGANVIVAAPPADPRVSCVLFATNDGFDHRTDAQSRLESYVVAGPLSTMLCYGTQIAGQRALLVYQRVEQPLPEVGSVFYIGVEYGTLAQQYVRVTKVEHAVQTFEDVQGLYDRRVITLTISDPLRQNWPGLEPSRYATDSPTSTMAKVRKTSVADASKYYGVAPLALAASTGALTLKTNTIYSPLVPSATTETPIALGEIPSTARILASGAAITLASAVWGGSVHTIYLRGQVVPLSLVMSIGATNDYWPKADDGSGNIIGPSGAIVGSIDYESGALVPDTSQVLAWAAGASSAITYTPGTKVVQNGFTRSIAITLGTRGQVYVQTLKPVPAPGTLFVDYMALGKWYRLQDNGLGVLKGAETAFGTGSISYSTGSAVITLGALPDVGSAVVFSWGSAVDTRVRTATASALTMRMRVAHQSATRSTVTVTFTKGGAVKTLTESGSGVLSGSGITGTIDYLTGDIVINSHRDFGTNLTVAYSYGDVSGEPVLVTENFADIARNVDGTIDVPLANTSPVVPHTFKMSWPATFLYGGTSTTLLVKDDGAGTLKHANGVTAGTINYTTGAINFHPDADVIVPVPSLELNSAGGYNYLGSSYGVAQPFVAAINVPITCTYQNTASQGTLTSVSEDSAPPLTFDLAPGLSETLVPNGLQFTLAGASTYQYVERGGVIVRDPSFTTSAGTDAGSVDYSLARVSVSTWPATLGTSPIVVQSCLTAIAGRSEVAASFRTAGAPIRVASLYVQATGKNGTAVTATTDNNGIISGTYVRGSVNVVTGVAAVEFGHIVTAAGNESQWWYDAAKIVGGNIWQPLEVVPGTIKYNAVVVATLPLDAALIGLDPVRLPADGRVPIFRPGDLAVVHHTASKAPQTVANGQTVDLLRTRLSRVRVIGNDGATITAGYTTDLDAGTVTFTDITGYSQPIHIENRIEDMVVLSDAQIDGTLQIIRQLTHDFPLGSYVSSALVIGNMRARVSYLFDQATWNGTWSDSIVGSPATATFNDLLAPIIVTNEGAITERWAIRFTNTTAFEIIGEHVGVIGIGNTATDCSPINPATGAPYFTITATGWGSGWAAGNVLLHKTIGALYPFWIARTVQQGEAASINHSFAVLVRGDIDRP